jgi:hypothetical protein
LAFWSIREELSLANRLRRSYYELLRDELDQQMIQYGLIDSLKNFNCKKLPFPFVEKRELKPRARIPDVEYDCQNTFLVIFVEDTIPASCKKYIRFFDDNKVAKSNLLQSKNLLLTDTFDRNQKYIDSTHFVDFLRMLLPVDYSLLIQRDPASHNRDRYCLTHFHVRIDWPIAEAAENLALGLRYISKDLYEKGDKYAEDIQKKFFEYYGLPVMAGGRRTAAIVAAQYLKRIPCISTVYVGSSESRSMIRISERGVSKYVLLQLTATEIETVAKNHHITLPTFYKNYIIIKKAASGVCIFQVTYAYTNQARPPDDGKLREIKPDLHWLSVTGQHIIPKPGTWKFPPLPTNFIYA